MREQAAKAEANLAASANRKRQPVLHRVDGASRGGLFDKIWMKGEGLWIQTEKRLGRGMEWLANEGPRISVREAWGRPGDRHRLRNAVLGRWLRWEGTEGDHQLESTELVVADAVNVHGTTTLGGAVEVGGRQR